jgi:O-methyltransferase
MTGPDDGVRDWTPLWPACPPRGYLGQLDPEFQRQMSERRAGAPFEACDRYHTFDLPDGGVIRGAWDLRGSESEYLGGVEFGGKRMLELGPSSGYLTFWMERQGAEVVSVEAGFDVSIDLLPVDGIDTAPNRMILMRSTIDSVHNSWWRMHRTYGSSAELVHGDIYHLPGDLGSFDVGVFGSILLHLREPWGR